LSQPTRRSPRLKRLHPKYRSKFEGKVAEILEKRKLNYTYEATTLPYTLSLTYKPDWTMANGVHLEAKGKFDYVERRKLLAVLATNPGTVVHMVFMRNQKLGKGSKMTYGEWCDKHGIKWSVYPELPL
jgi:Phage endonuclease I